MGTYAGHFTGPISSAGGYNLKLFVMDGTAGTSVFTVTGIAVGDPVVACFKASGLKDANIAVSNLTSFAVAGTNTITTTGKSHANSTLLIGAYLDLTP